MHPQETIFVSKVVEQLEEGGGTKAVRRRSCVVGTRTRPTAAQHIAMVRSISRAESVRRYFLTLPASDRSDILTVRDVGAEKIMRCMQDMQAEAGGASPLLFSFSGVAHRCNLKSYGQWLVVSKHSKAQVARAPTMASLTKTRCPAELIMSQRVLDACARLERVLRLDFNSTLSVPVRNEFQ